MLHRPYSKVLIFFLFLLLLPMKFGCDKKKYEQVPYVPVDISINLFPNLSMMGIGETVLILSDENNNGYIQFNDAERQKIYLNSKVYGNGIILYRYDREDFYAYDRTCTFRPITNNCAIEPDKSGILPKCPCCSSVFIITVDGLPTDQSPAHFSLKPYNAYVTQYGILRIIN
ncbi:MAG: hypothetical protein ACOC2E_09185 [Bacteroidota bacterium]